MGGFGREAFDLGMAIRELRTLKQRPGSRPGFN
jgi:hypothetical protein